jgi:hypothetical protein
MKTKNKLIITAMAIVTIITMSLAVVGCSDESPEPEQAVGSITEYGTGTTINIYKGAGADSSKVTATVGKIQSAYGNSLLSDATKTALQGKITKIVIVGGVNYSTTAGIIEIGEDLSISGIIGLFGIAAVTFNT